MNAYKLFYMNTKHFNRIKSKSPRKSYHYCSCDMNMVSPGERCSVCGRVSKKGKRKFKKHLDFN